MSWISSRPAPRVAVVTISFNGRQHIDECFGSLAALDYPREAWRLVVVDNASQDGSLAHVRAHYPDAELLPQGRNRGFAGGNDAGMRWALAQGYDYVALLNDDTRVEPEWLRAMVETAEAAPDIGACASKILTWDGSLIEFSGSVFFKETTGGGYTDEPNDGRYDRVMPAGYACGGACLLRVSALREIGLYDEDFFCYHEDVDWSLRAWLAGWRVLYVPASVIYHKRGSASAGTAFRDYIGPRNALTTWLKCYEARTMRRFGAFVWRVYTGAPHLRRGLAYNLAVLPRTLIKRHQVQRLRRIADEEFFRRLSPAG